MSRLRTFAILFGVLLLSVWLIGCGSTKAPQQMTPGSRLIYHGGQAIWTACNRGDRLYVNETGNFHVVPGGCAYDQNP